MTDQDIHKLGEVLRSAREAKGVDLARVERETKIRTRYLGALENGDYRELPGSVYTKGFLRNYGAYLGLDPEYLVDLYRLESTVALNERPTVSSPPRPITTRRSRALVITPGLVGAVLLTAVVVGLVGWISLELITFAGVPELRITDPAGDLPNFDGDEYTIVGVTEPNSRVEVDGLRQNPTANADAEGNFEIDVALVPGSNVISLTATDPLTSRTSEPVVRTIMVVGDLPSASPEGVVTVSAPEDGATASGPVEITGSAAPEATVTVTAALVTPAPATIRITTLAGQDVPLPTATPAPPEALELTATEDGSFTGAIQLAPGTWQLSIAGESGEPLTRRVVVQPASGLRGSLRVAGNPSYLELDEDGTPKAGVSGRIAAAGTDVELTAESRLRIRVGNAGAVTVVINGVNLGTMGGQGAVVEWAVIRL